jgi:hypothetical protein
MSIRILTLSAALLVGGGCVSYSYHPGNGGDYYSGTPSVEYRYIGGYYGYGYSPYWYGGYGYPGYYGGYPHYGHRHGYYGGYGYPYWGSPYYYGGAWGYRHGPYKPPRYNPPPTVTPPNPPPRTVRYLDSPNDAKRFHHDREGAPGRYGYSTPPNMAGGVQRAPSRPYSPPPSRPVSPPQQQLISPPPSTPRVVPPSRPVPATPGPSSAVAPARRADAEAPLSKGGARARSRSIDPNDP